MAKASNKSASFLDRSGILGSLTDEDYAKDVQQALAALVIWSMSGENRYSTVGRTKDGSAVLITLKDGSMAEYYYSFSNSLQAALFVTEIANEVSEALAEATKLATPPKKNKS